MKHTASDAIVTSVLLVAAMVGAWRWQQAIAQQQSIGTVAESWQHVQERFPMPEESKPSPELPTAMLQEVIRANPFAAQRRQVPQPGPGSPGGGSAAPGQPALPQFVYKGRITMGAGQRAVIEEIVTKKTYFLQIGQEVAGFKVLDISETQVVLSQPGIQESLTLRLTPKP